MNETTIDTDANMIDGEPVSEKHLARTPVLGYILIQYTREDGSRMAYFRPKACMIGGGGSVIGGLGELSKNEEIKGVIPAEPGTFEVSGVGIDMNNSVFPLRTGWRS